ncbi:unnamed protein product [Brassicogethes aeneus]|uniref:Uncharacterized protein n=1 Tax=Brassicogethes aeneus TaxID=1431903 RepID=A0A9P0B399_BRAAE|nr:unnamed protein product [Brassicogethes aeneus]
MPVSLKFSAVAILFAMFCYAECSGNCLKYGHACWGAHGKRSGSHTLPVEKEEVTTKDIVIPKWFLQKILQNPLEPRYLRRTNQDSAGQHGEQLFSGIDNDLSFKGQEAYDGFEDLIDDMDFEDSKRDNLPMDRKPKLLLEKRSTLKH